MIITQRQSIYWGEVGGIYMYGTTVSYYPDKSVRLYNPLLPSGEILKTWFSSVNYQAARTQPQLPLLKRKQEYQLSLVFDCQPENGVYTKITFFDRYGDILEKKVEKVKDFIFTYPEDSYTYQVSLLSAGFESLTFYHFSIKEIRSV
ncbi:accessory secretory protein Asp3 [Streptococcus pneumoniae]|nr:accessory Sec system protein Asp3 [Streptococcus pneumoniae]MDS3194280.1 accessory Sec system protein Asp3 [Streptococcus pneumoniae]MDS3292320.1 accessory Sec system protein Asp3 [Streptococcus pneumoniae]MDS3323236.1 accessory Sec system protein Asp3 [Streptococcus pneumoniae]MDS3484717.1 accessory Sec system protein Asp3 [Streptococcus pneumoniae]